MGEQIAAPAGGRSATGATAVLYVSDLGLMASFYERCLGGVRVESDGDGYRILGTGGWELSLVPVPQAIAATFELADPPRRRECSPVKLSFEVANIEALRQVLGAAGGQVDPGPGRAVSRDWRHVDCVDPEGNVVQLRETRGPTYADRDLTGWDFRGRDLGATSLAYSNLTNARFGGADLTEACLDGTNLTRADFTDAKLNRASLTDANLTRASLVRADCRSVDFSGANLTGSDLTVADLRSAKLCWANLTYATVEGIDLDRAELTSAVGLRLRGAPTRMSTGWDVDDGTLVESTR